MMEVKLFQETHSEVIGHYKMTPLSKVMSGSGKVLLSLREIVADNANLTLTEVGI